MFIHLVEYFKNINDGVSYLANIIVKVGRTSNLKFRNVKAFRAIDFKDVDTIIDKYGDVSALIVEGISKSETINAINKLKELKENGINIFIHNEFEDDTLTSISKQLNINMSTSLDDLQHNISNTIAIKVYTAWCRKIADRIEQKTTTENVDNIDRLVENNRITDTKLTETLSAFDEESEERAENIIDNKDDLWEALGLEVNDGDEDRVDLLDSDREREIGELKELLEDVTKQKNLYKSKLEYTEDRLGKIIEIKESIEAERNQLKELIETLKQSAGIERPVAGALLDEANAEIDELKQTIISLQQKEIEYDAEKKQEEDYINELKLGFKSEKDKLESEIEELKCKVNELTDSVNTKDEELNKMVDTASKLESAQFELMKLRNNKSMLEKRIVSLQGNIDELNDKIEKAYGESSVEDTKQIELLKNNIENLNTEIEELNNKLGLEIRGREVVTSLLEEATSQKSKASDALIEKNNEISELKAVVKNMEDTLGDSESKIQQLEENINEVKKELEDSKQANNIEIFNIQSEYTEKIKELTIDRDTRVQEVVRVRDELRELKETLADKEAELAKLILENRDAEEENIKILETRDILEKDNEMLKGKVETLVKETRSLTSKLSMTEDANERLEKLNKKLKKDNKKADGLNAVTNNMYDISRFRLEKSIKYSGKAKIITVFGSGSYGVTTTSVSIARRIPKSKILLMDMDIINPKADAFFRKSPIINSLTDIKEQLGRSSFGALIEKGSKYAVRNINKIIQNGTETQAGAKIDYFSGVYTKIDLHKLSAIDFSELFETLGNMYDYIIIDAGIMGASSVSDELLREFNRISYTSIIVTLNENCDLRNANMRLNQTGLNMDNSFWVLNMSDSSKVCDMFKKVKGKSKPVILPKDSSLKGNGMSFDKVPMLRDRVNEMVDNILR